MNTDLFHAYVIGGTRDTARAHIELLLAPHVDIEKVETDHVTFTIENARMLKEWQQLTPGSGSRKLYIAYTDFITREAENALLKTLEEPVAGTHIIFAIPNPDMLLPTLRSRVRIILPEQTREKTTHAASFLKMTRKNRLDAVSKMIEKGDDDDASALLREKALSFLGELERELAKDVEHNAKKLEHILVLKKYLYIPGSSVRMILETLALEL